MPQRRDRLSIQSSANAITGSARSPVIGLSPPCVLVEGSVEGRLPLGRAVANEYAVATLSTARGDIAVRLAGGTVKIFRFPITERVVQPLRRDGR